jgi:hypothetical protein
MTWTFKSFSLFFYRRVPKSFRQETAQLMAQRTDNKIEWAVSSMQAMVSGVPGWRFDTAYAFAEWYNNRVPGALDLAL